MKSKYVDTTRWQLKRRQVEAYVIGSIPETVRKLVDEVHKETIKNLSGPQIHPRVKGVDNSAIGEMPVPRRTSMLVHSIKRGQLYPWLQYVFSDPRTVPYNKYVHDGTRKMKPRRYLKDAVEKIKALKFKQIKADFLRGLRQVGQA